jgi:hypothetical protein
VQLAIKGEKPDVVLQFQSILFKLEVNRIRFSSRVIQSQVQLKEKHECNPGLEVKMIGPQHSHRVIRDHVFCRNISVNSALNISDDLLPL